MALDKGIWDPKPRIANIKGTNLKSLMVQGQGFGLRVLTNSLVSKDFGFGFQLCMSCS